MLWDEPLKFLNQRYVTRGAKIILTVFFALFRCTAIKLNANNAYEGIERERKQRIALR